MIRMSLPINIDPRFELSAIGGWDRGGFLEIRFGNKLVDGPLVLTVSEWGIIAILMKAANAASSSHWASAFVSSGVLATELKRRSHRGSGKKEDVHRIIHRIRKLLSQSCAAKYHLKAGVTWAKLILEKQSGVGYRLSLDAQQLHLIELSTNIVP